MVIFTNLVRSSLLITKVRFHIGKSEEQVFNVAARFIKTVKAAAHSDFVLVQSRANSVV